LIGSLAVSGVILLAMIAVSGYGASTVPPQTRIPLPLGIASYSYWAPKRAALVIWPAIGALVGGVVGALMASNAAYNWSPAGREVLTPALMCILVTFQAGAIITARRSPAISSAQPSAARTEAGGDARTEAGGDARTEAGGDART
jgi:hypothetical protein